MRPPRRRAEETPERPLDDDADVIVDVVFEDGLLFVDLENIGRLPAHRVRVRFEPSFRGAGGRRTSALTLFRRLEFLAPSKRIRVFVDRSESYFARGEPTALEATVTWLCDSGDRRRRTIRHDLSVYRDLVYLVKEVPRVADDA